MERTKEFKKHKKVRIRGIRKGLKKDEKKVHKEWREGKYEYTQRFGRKMDIRENGQIHGIEMEGNGRDGERFVL